MQFSKWALIILSIVGCCLLVLVGWYLYLRVSCIGVNIERTVAIIKPDAVSAKCTGKIIDRIEQEGFTIVELKKITLSKELAEQFYEMHKELMFYRELIDFMVSGPCIVMVLERENAIKVWRDLIGSTDPKEAKDGTLRKQFGTNISKNAVHGSDSDRAAKREMGLLFGVKG